MVCHNVLQPLWGRDLPDGSMKPERTVKPVAFTAVIALLVAIPLLLKWKRNPLVVPEVRRSGGWDAEDQRYDIDDFMT